MQGSFRVNKGARPGQGNGRLCLIQTLPLTWTRTAFHCLEIPLAGISCKTVVRKKRQWRPDRGCLMTVITLFKNLDRPFKNLDRPWPVREPLDDLAHDLTSESAAVSAVSAETHPSIAI